ncbi:chromosome segregation and condensation protein ScpA [Gordonia hirsuta DSM 44140 = NBRC 16056]|uniref:Segregation and condensation protein A n=1 Tax=Gordonia hirsuta DSM 44140 = NBRC 16056 TaxID=1121927 RepID=L7L511_9ACTN|nr:segregation/condensation protein A [Gordonia hirsuta]GAC56009.1 chromosome segregation and condensation protein ScpA [Gordonia hirsuta DSM 44140 = NBRC 16056]
MTPGIDLETAAGEATAAPGRFEVKLDNFTGPFDLLLNLISQHRLDVTEVALHVVTDDFIAYTKSLGPDADLEQTTEFLVIAATLLDLKAARLLPSGEVDDPEDLALLEARDLLFARLLQYRAYKQVALLFAELEATALQRYPRAVSLEERYAELLPEVELGVDVQRFAEIAAAAMAPKPQPTVGLSHLHGSHVSVPEQAKRIGTLLRTAGGRMLTFAELVADCDSGLEVVASFLGLLELYRERAVTFDQEEALGELKVGWTGDAEDADLEKAMAKAEEEYG